MIGLLVSCGEWRGETRRGGRDRERQKGKLTQAGGDMASWEKPRHVEKGEENQEEVEKT